MKLLLPLLLLDLLLGSRAARAQNVGSGTSTPSQKLEVTGKLRLSATNTPATVYGPPAATGSANLLAVAYEQPGGLSGVCTTYSTAGNYQGSRSGAGVSVATPPSYQLPDCQ